ncbi:cyclic nucleotide-binding domain-containing protein [Hymenobacter ruber]
MERWYRFLGVRPHETTSVWLLFAHNSLLSFGTVLVYLAATALLLARHPASSLPVAYCVGAAAMALTGSLYAYLERRWLGPSLAVRALLAVVAIAVVLALAWQPVPSVATAVAIMTGYRLLYLLTNLEAWSMSAALFNARQGRRLFGVVSSGELPAKAVGAALAIFVPAAHAISMLLIMALSAYLLAALVQQAAFRRRTGLPHLPSVPPAGRTLPLIRQLLGPGALVRVMGLSVMAVAALAVGVEYVFLLSVRNFLPGPVDVMQYLGAVLALAYLLAAAGRLLFARRGLAWVGVRRTLLLLPLIVLGSVLVFWLLRVLPVGPWGQLVYFSGLYLGLEICRRALFEPVFLVLFHRLPPPEHLAGRSVVKGIYEPVGVGLGGLLLLAAQPFPTLSSWLPFVWMAALVVGVVYLLRYMLWHYLEALKTSLYLRGTSDNELISAGVELPDRHSAEADSSVDMVLQAIEHLHKIEAAALLEQSEHLLTHPSNRIRHRALRLLGARVELPRLRQLALEDPDPALREMASCLAAPHPSADDLLLHPDWAVRQGAIRGRLGAHPTDGAALASLAALASSTETNARHAALELIALLTPNQQQQTITTCLHSAEPTLVQAAVRAVAEVPGPDMISLMMGFLCIKKVQKPALAGLVRIGAPVLPLLKPALAQECDPRRAQAMAQVCARMATPAARQVLLEIASGTNLQARAAALRALDSFATMPSDAPLFQQLIEEEMRLAQHFLHGMHAANSELRAALRQELRRCTQRLFGLLMQVYERPPLQEAQHGAIHTTGETQASALEILENIIPLPLFAGLQAMLETGRLSQRAEVMDALLGPITTAETVQTTVVRRGAEAFTAWTISVALRQWHPQPATVAYLVSHLQATSLLVQESALAVLQQLPVLRPAAYDQLLLTHPAVAFLAMNPPTTTPRTTARDRVLILKGTSLFANTPENILGSIEPIMREVTFDAGQEIFSKGSLGTSLFIVNEGEIGIFDGPRQLTTFHSGDFFGELALLDAEARSASAVALGPATAFRIDQEDFYDVMEDCPEVTRNILKVLCQRLRRQNERMQPPQPVAG